MKRRVTLLIAIGIIGNLPQTAKAVNIDAMVETIKNYSNRAVAHVAANPKTFATAGAGLVAGAGLCYAGMRYKQYKKNMLQKQRDNNIAGITSHDSAQDATTSLQHNPADSYKPIHRKTLEEEAAEHSAGEKKKPAKKDSIFRIAGSTAVMLTMIYGAKKYELIGNTTSGILSGMTLLIPITELLQRYCKK